MNKRPFVNRLNDLDTKAWLKFQKSWFIHSPPPRLDTLLRHPAKFPETMAQEFIEFFTKKKQVVLDPMAGTASALVGALRAGRHSYGIELNPTYVELGRDVINQERTKLGERCVGLQSLLFEGNASEYHTISTHHDIPLIDYIFTSPPYWNMLRAPGAQTQKKRRTSSTLDLYYSEDPSDLGNIPDYDLFLKTLVDIYAGLKPHLRPRAYLTIIVKNIKKGGKVYPLAWDLSRGLSDYYTLKDEKIWCQDDIRLAPYGLGNAWVSNTFHHYCLQFRND